MASVPAKTAHKNQCTHASFILTHKRFFVMLSGVWIRVSTLNASDVEQGIAADVKELLAFSHISEKPTQSGRGSSA
jgi:outer membrane cobalamin receptor